MDMFPLRPSARISRKRKVVSSPSHLIFSHFFFSFIPLLYYIFFIILIIFDLQRIWLEWRRDGVGVARRNHKQKLDRYHLSIISYVVFLCIKHLNLKCKRLRILYSFLY
jgi:hypothetical protein